MNLQHSPRVMNFQDSPQALGLLGPPDAMSAQGSHGTRQFLGAAALLIREGGTPSCPASAGAALERFFSRLGKRLTPLVGEAGYRTLLQEAHRKVVRQHPVLENYPVSARGNPFFGGLQVKALHEDPAEFWEGTTALLGELMNRVDTLGREGEIQSMNGAAPTVQPGPFPEIEPHPASNLLPDEPWAVLVMDRDRLTCEAMAGALGSAADFHVVGQAMTAADVKRMTRNGKIDFVVVSARLPADEVLEVCRWFRREDDRNVPEVVVTGLPDDDAVILSFLEAGAVAFTMEEFSVEGLRVVLRLSARGESVFPLRLQHLMSLRLSELAELLRDRGLDHDTLSALTSREGEVLLLLDEGLTNRQIAKKLFISEGTVKSHVHQILKKLKVRDRSEAVRLLALQRAAPGKLVLTKTGFRREAATAAT
jgi:DNA-binding NarL/FixJ family response regulator